MLGRTEALTLRLKAAVPHAAVACFGISIQPPGGMANFDHKL